MSPRSKRHSFDDREPLPAPEVTPEQVLAHLSTLTQPASIRQIAHGMDLKHRGRRYLPRVIQQLKRSGDIEEIHGGRYRLAGAKHVKQALPARPAAQRAAQRKQQLRKPEPMRRRPQTKRRARPPQNSAATQIWFPAASLRIAMATAFSFRTSRFRAWMAISSSVATISPTPCTAISVLARIERRRADGRAEGRVVQIVEREHPTLVGLFRYGPHGNVRSALRHAHPARSR